VILVAVAAAGVGFITGRATEEASPSSLASVSGDQSTTTSALTSTTESADGVLADGRHFGYLTNANFRERLVTFDLAQWFAGEEANRAAAEDGLIEPGDNVPNDYHVRNTNTRLRRLPVASNPVVVIARTDCQPTCDPAGTFEGLAGSFADMEPHDLYSAYRGPDTQYWLTVQQGVVTKIEEQYVP
jgi:hypothetical protein